MTELGVAAVVVEVELVELVRTFAGSVKPDEVATNEASLMMSHVVEPVV